MKRDDWILRTDRRCCSPAYALARGRHIPNTTRKKRAKNKQAMPASCLMILMAV